MALKFGTVKLLWISYQCFNAIILDNGVYGDLGVYPIAIRLKNNVLKYLHHVHSLPETSPVKWVFKELELFHNSGFSNWVNMANALYSEHVLSAYNGLETFLSLGKDQMKQKLKKLSHENFRGAWFLDINNSEKQPKLRTYKKIKSEFCMESYLNLHNVKLRTAIARFWLSAHHLRIETGLTHRLKRGCASSVTETLFKMKNITSCSVKHLLK